MSTIIIDKEEAKASASVAGRVEKRSQPSPLAAQNHEVRTEPKAAQVASVESYVSCLDLAADFLARG